MPEQSQGGATSGREENEDLQGIEPWRAGWIRWVARHVDQPNPDPNDWPDAFAWTLLRQCRAPPRRGNALVPLKQLLRGPIGGPIGGHKGAQDGTR